MNTSFIESRALRIEMIKRGLSRHDLAAMTGLTPGTISNMISGLQSGPKSIAAIEKALNTLIYTPADEAEKLGKLESYFGFNPKLATIHVLRQTATEKNLPHRSHLHKAELILRLQEYLISQQNLRSKKPKTTNKKSKHK